MVETKVQMSASLLAGSTEVQFTSLICVLWSQRGIACDSRMFSKVEVRMNVTSLYKSPVHRANIATLSILATHLNMSAL